MKHRFCVLYGMDCTLGEAVAAYLDAEHYAYLHQEHICTHEALHAEGNKIVIRQTWKLLGFTVGNECTAEYQVPGRFLQYNFKPYPHWLPSIYHLIKPYTDLNYYPDPTGTHTVSELWIELDMPFFLWPLRGWLEKKLRKLKIDKDQEDMDMIARRHELFGRGNMASYFSRNQFMLHKQAFMAYFNR